jgi:hypothetical protein
MSQAAQFYSSLPFLLALTVLIYFGLRRIAPIAARISLSLGGALAGSFFAPALLLVLIQPFRNGWNLFGLYFWGAPILFVGGGIAGLLAVLWWTAPSTLGRRKLKIALFSTVLMTPVVLFVLPRIVMFATNNGRPDDLHARSIAIYEFTASPQSLAFPIPTQDGGRALVFVDRATRQARLIGENGFSYGVPRLSWDGERLLFVRQKKESRHRELISCFVQTWQCRFVIQTDNDVVSPVEIEKDVIVYSSSPLVTLPDRQRYSRHDFYLVKVGSDPIQLSDFGEIALYSINVSGDRILFGSSGSFLEKSVFPKPPSVPFDLKSEIFELRWDREALRVLTPTEKLKPQFLVGGYSTHPSASEDGEKVAFLNTELGKGNYRFNLMVVDTASGLKKLIKLEGKDFSAAAFAGEQMLFNELLNDRYRVRAWNRPSDAIEEVFEIDFSKLRELEHISLTLTAK